MTKYQLLKKYDSIIWCPSSFIMTFAVYVSSVWACITNHDL
jgi:hypothetical protein